MCLFITPNTKDVSSVCFVLLMSCARIVVFTEV